MLLGRAGLALNSVLKFQGFGEMESRGPSQAPSSWPMVHSHETEIKSWPPTEWAVVWGASMLGGTVGLSTGPRASLQRWENHQLFCSSDELLSKQWPFQEKKNSSDLRILFFLSASFSFGSRRRVIRIIQETGKTSYSWGRMNPEVDMSSPSRQNPRHFRSLASPWVHTHMHAHTHTYTCTPWV